MPDTLQEKVIEALGKCPMTSKQLFDELPAKDLKEVSNCLQRLKQKCTVNSFKLEDGIYWKLTKKPYEMPNVIDKKEEKTEQIMPPETKQNKPDIDAALDNWNTLPTRQIIDDIIKDGPLTVKILQRCYKFAIDTDAPEPIPTLLERHINHLQELVA